MSGTESYSKCLDLTIKDLRLYRRRFWIYKEFSILFKTKNWDFKKRHKNQTKKKESSV
jgi:hypothetical protein